MAVFDKEAENYDEWYVSKLGRFVDEVESSCAFGLFDIPKGSRILEVGCGTGNFSIKLAKMGYEVVAIDVSEEMLLLAREKAKVENLSIEFHKLDICENEFEDGSFDGIFSMAVFEFIPDSLSAMDQMMRTLRSEGQLIIGTINRDSAWGDFYESEYVKENSVFKNANLKSMDEMKNMYSENLNATSQCLFISPLVSEEDITMEDEMRLREEGEKGGFICLKWIK